MTLKEKRLEELKNKQPYYESHRKAVNNPLLNALTFTGAAIGSYDGSVPVTIDIPSGGGGKWRYINTIVIPQEKASSYCLIDKDANGKEFNLDSISISPEIISADGANMQGYITVNYNPAYPAYAVGDGGIVTNWLYYSGRSYKRTILREVSGNSGLSILMDGTVTMIDVPKISGIHNINFSGNSNKPFYGKLEIWGK